MSPLLETRPTIAAATGAGGGAALSGTGLLDRAYDEYCRREDAGEPVDAAEFCAAYPEIQNSLALLLSAHRRVQEDPHFLERLEETRWPKVGETFLGFHLEDELGRGAFSHVFLATEPALGDRRVVVKVSHGGCSEALTLGRLEHRNIVPVYSVRSDDASGLSAVCMPHLGDATLGHLIDRVLSKSELPRSAQIVFDTACAGIDSPGESAAATALPYSAAIREIAVQLLDALAFIHGEGVCHRDLKPSNVLLTRDGVPMLLDFNLAEDSRRGENRFGGTPLYMSPEQLGVMEEADVGPVSIDARSDLFSLGVIVYELLTGMHPFAPPAPGAPTAEVVRHLLEKQKLGAPPVRERNPGVDHRLAEWVHRCLACDREDRPASAEVARAALAPRTTRARRWLSSPRRHPWIAATFLLIALAAASPLPGAAVRWAIPPLTDLQKAQLAEDGADLEAAVDHLGKHLESNRHDVAARLRRGRACLLLAESSGFSAEKERRYLDTAFSEFTESDNLQPAGALRGRTKACLAYTLHLQKNLASARFWYQQALTHGDESAAVHNNLGALLLDHNEATQAESLLTRAVDLEPTLQAAHYNRGILYLTKGVSTKDKAEKATQLHAAHADLRRAIDIGPGSAELYRKAADVCAWLAPSEPDRAAAAIDYLDHALAHGLDPAVLGRHPFSTFLKTHPRFAALAERAPVVAEVRAVRVVRILPD